MLTNVEASEDDSVQKVEVKISSHINTRAPDAPHTRALDAH